MPQGVTGAVPGTLIFDSSDMKVKLKQASSWKDYTIDSTGKADLSIQNKYTELTSAKVSIGKPTATPGILVLEDTDKGMILPLVDNCKAVQSPTAGLIVYDTALKMLCTYNGTVWSFWTVSFSEIKQPGSCSFFCLEKILHIQKRFSGITKNFTENPKPSLLNIG